jgi:hypothetical protein
MTGILTAMPGWGRSADRTRLHVDSLQTAPALPGRQFRNPARSPLLFSYPTLEVLGLRFGFLTRTADDGTFSGCVNNKTHRFQLSR